VEPAALAATRDGREPAAPPAHAGALASAAARAPRGPAAHAAAPRARAVADALATTLAPVEDPATADTLAPAASAARTVRSSPPSAEQPGRYRRGRELGRGGMGRVVLAVDDQLGREVAIKEIRTGSGGASVGEVIRFVREARVTGQLEHPGIVPVHELARSADGTFYYTMKRIRGQSLAAALRSARTVEDRVALLRHFRDVCEAVAYAHSRGVVHRDLKPDNIMVGGFGETLVVDWGIAKVRGLPDVPPAVVSTTAAPRTEVAADDDARPIDEGALIDAPMTEAGHAIGTPAYMSPEQARGDLEAIDERSDVWGLGAVLFEILTGRPPFVGNTALAILSAVLVDPPPGVLTIAADAPPELAAIADRALSRDRAARYASAKEIADEIGAWQDGRQVRAYRYGAWDLVRRFVRRHRAASIAAVSIALAVVGAALFMTWSYRAEVAQRRDAETRALIAEAGRLDQLGHRPQAFALLRAAASIGGPAIEPALARAGLLAHADEPQPIVLAGHTSLVADLAFAADGAHVVTCSQDRTLREWDVATGRLVRTIQHDRRMHAIVASDDGTRWLTPSDADDPTEVAFTVWEAESGRALRDLGTGLYAESLAITRNGQRAASAGRDGTVRIWDLASGEGRIVAQHGGWVRALSFSPDGTALMIGGRGPRVQIVTDDGERALEGIEGEVRALDWSDGDRIAVGRQDGSLALFRASDGTRERVVAAHRGPVVDAELARDGTRGVPAPQDRRPRGWSAGGAAPAPYPPHRGRVSAAHFDAAGTRVATAEIDQRAALVWTLPAETGLVLRGHDGWVHDAVFSPDGVHVASASRDGTVRLWNSETGLEERVLTGHEGSVYCVRFASDGSVVGSGGRDGTVRLWDAVTGGARLTVAAHGDAVYDLAFLEGERIASVSVDGSVRVSSTRDGAELWSHRGTLPLNALASHAGELALGDTTGGIEVWQVGESEPSRRFTGHSGAIRSPDFPADGALLVSGALDGHVILWEAANGRSVRELAESERGITAVDLASDGARIVTASEDGLVRVWDALTGHLGTTLDGQSPNVRAASFSPSGDRIVSGGADQTVRIWRSVRAETRAVLAESAAETNLRACHDDVTVVSVVLGPGVDPIWAPESLCTAAP